MCVIYFIEPNLWRFKLEVVQWQNGNEPKSMMNLRIGGLAFTLHVLQVFTTGVSRLFAEFLDVDTRGKREKAGVLNVGNNTSASHMVSFENSA